MTTIAVAGGLALGAAVGVAVAAIPGTDNVINGCYHNTLGTLRVIDATKTKCLSVETPLSWNQQGAKGDPGPAGAAGPTGPQGPPGVGDTSALGKSAYMTCVATKQGPIAGSVTTTGYEGSIAVDVAEHSIVSPRDPASGLPTGKRQHKPFVITKATDKATPLLYNAMVNNEHLTTCSIKFVRVQQDGTLSNYFTVKLTNATLASIDFRKGDARSGAGRFGEYESIGLTYQKIEWTFTQGGITAEDDWESPVA